MIMYGYGCILPIRDMQTLSAGIKCGHLFALQNFTFLFLKNMRAEGKFQQNLDLRKLCDTDTYKDTLVLFILDGVHVLLRKFPIPNSV